MRVVVLYAVSAEGMSIKRALSDREPASRHSHIGYINDNKVICIETQMGKVNAACESVAAIMTHTPDFVISTGIGGAYPATGLNVGDVAVAISEIYGDEGVLLKDDFLDTIQMGIPLLKKGQKLFFNEFDMDTPISQKAYEIISDGLTRHGVKMGKFLTVSSCTGDSERAVMLRDKHSVICESMEGAAVAHVCAKYNVPFIEIRGISNIVSDRDKDSWDIKIAIKNCSNAVILLLKSLDKKTLRGIKRAGNNK